MSSKRVSAPPTSSSVPTLWPHQLKTKKLFEGKHRGFDASDPGTGKTRAALELYANRKGRGRLLIVCPKTLMYSAWGADIEKFTPWLTVGYSSAEDRDTAFNMGTDAVVINTDGVKWLEKSPKLLRGFDHLIIDEISTFKHMGSQRSKAIKNLRKFFVYRFGMTGTPNPNSVTEMWHPMLILDDGQRLGTSSTRFRNIMQSPTQTGPMPNHLTWRDKAGAPEALKDLIADMTVRHEFEEVMTHVPANHRHFKDFELSKTARAAYKKMAEEAIIELDKSTVTAVHAAALRTKLLQIASGAVYTGDGAYKVIDKTRYELICDLIEERKFSVVFFNWKHQRDSLCAMLDTRDTSFAVIDGDTNSADRDRIVVDYQAGKYQTLLMHPRTGAHGLTLTRGTTTIVSSPIYEADLLKQGIHRIYRGGQTKITNTIFVEAKDTIEREVYEHLLNKESNMRDLLTMLKEAM